MEITRKMNIGEMEQNLTYTLTTAEMGNAYAEVQEEKIASLMSAVLEDKEYENAEEIPAELIEEMKQKFRKEIGDIMRKTMWNVIDTYADRLEEYKEKWKSFYCEVTQSRCHTFYIKAKNEHDAEDLINKYLEVREDEADDEFRYEEPEYDIGWLRETDIDPDECDVKEEDF